MRVPNLVIQVLLSCRNQVREKLLKQGKEKVSSATGASHYQNPRRTKDPLVSALPQPREGLCQGAGTACSQQTPESAQPGRRVGGETAGRSRRSSRAGGDHKWRSVVKHGGEHRLTLTFTAPPRKAWLVRLSQLWNTSRLRWINPGTSFLCMFALTHKHSEVLTTHILHKSRRPKLSGYSGNLVLNGIVNERKEITDKGNNHKGLQSNLG